MANNKYERGVELRPIVKQLQLVVRTGLETSTFGFNRFAGKIQTRSTAYIVQLTVPLKRDN